MLRSVPSANSRGAAFLFAAFAATSCTSILGIDGNYYSDQANSGGSSDGGKANASGGKTSVAAQTGGATHHDAGSSGSGGERGSGGVKSSGGATPDASAGGRTNPGGGGTETSGAGGASSGGRESGGASGTSESGGSGASGGDGGSTGTPPGDSGVVVCPLGTFMGTYSGMHLPSTGIGQLAAQITGSITLRFTATTNPAQRAVTGGVAFLATATSGGFAGTFLGTFDCELETGSVSLIDPTDITTIVPPEVAVLIDGKFEIQPGPNGGLKGTFSIYESLNHTAKGSGSWSTN